MKHSIRRPYFAYGSNLNLTQMQTRCPTALPLYALAIVDWSLIFRETLDIFPSPGNRVVGALYSVTAFDVMALDEYEGVRDRCYSQIEVRISDSGEMAFAYRMYGGESVCPPSADYLANVEEGFRDWRLPLDTLEAALSHSRRMSPIVRKVA